ncbi:MAG TPA: 6-phosphogluconolactonase [Granulicella sp.]
MPRPVTVTYKVATSAGAVAEAAAALFTKAAVDAVAARGRTKIAISGGSTPKAMFALLADATKPFLAEVPWDKLDLYWVDERCVPPDDKDSNYRMTKEQMLSKVPLAEDRIHRMEGELEPEVAASRYESVLRNTFKLEGAETPTFDLVLLGMGDDGHTASLFPHTDGLNEIGRLVIANHVLQKETWRVTLTWPVINQGRQVAFLIEGAAKTDVLHRVLQGPYDPETLPSQLIRPASGKLLFLLDEVAAAKLPEPAGHESGLKVGILELDR